MNLAGDQIKDTYGALLNIGASGALSTLQPVTDGFGNVLPFEVSTTTFNFTGTVTGGPIGPTGAAGTSGTSGTSGVSGSSGTSGTDGTSGTSGINGATGPAGPTGAAAPGGGSPITVEQVNSLVSTAIGATATSGAYNAIAIGATATALAPNQIAIGTGIRTTCTNTGQNKIAIGFGIEQSANFNSNNTIEIGCHAAGASPLDGAGIIIGFGNNPQYGASSVTIGFSNARHSGDSITLGRNNCGWDNSVIVGNANCTGAGSGTLLVFGCSNQTNNSGGTIFGRGNTSLAGNEVILGNCNADYNGGGGNDMVIIGNSNSTNTVAFFHGLVAGNGNSASSIAWQSCDHSIIGQYNSKVGDGTAYCHSLVVGSNNCVSGNPGNCTNAIGHYNMLFPGATGSTVIGSSSVGATGIQNAVVLGNNLTSVGANRTHMRQPNVQSLPGPYASDAAYYSAVAGGTAGDFYLYTGASGAYLTVAGFN